MAGIVNQEKDYVEFQCNCGKKYVVAKSVMTEKGHKTECECGYIIELKPVYQCILTIPPKDYHKLNPILRPKGY